MHDDHGAPSSLDPATLDVALGMPGLAFPAAARAPDGAALDDVTAPSAQTSPPPDGPLGFHRGIWVVLVSAAATLLLLALYTFLSPAPTATLIVGPAQPGMRLFLDGVDHGPVPAVVPWLSAGEHEVVVARSGAPRGFISKISLAPGQTLELAPQVHARKRLRLLAGERAFGAEVDVQCGQEHLRSLSLPAAIGVPGTGLCTIRATTRSARGVREPAVQVVRLDDVEAERAILLNLPTPPLEHEAAPVVKPAELPQAVEPRAPASGGANRDPARSAVAPPIRSAPVAVLGLNSLPATTVLLDGRPMGKTPLRTEVVPGPHRATFIHPELGRRSVSVNAATDRENVAVVRF